MRAGLYWMYDADAKQSAPVFEATNDLIAIRKVEQLNKDNPYKDRIELWYLGWTDHDTMEIEIELKREIPWLEGTQEIELVERRA